MCESNIGKEREEVGRAENGSIIEIDHFRKIAVDTDSIHLHCCTTAADEEGIVVGILGSDSRTNTVDSKLSIADRNSDDLADVTTVHSADCHAGDRIRVHSDHLENHVHSSNRLASTWILVASV